MSTPLKKLPGYLGYLAGSFFICIIWLVEKVISLIKTIAVTFTGIWKSKK